VTQQAIRGALQTHLLTLGWADETAFEGRTFTPAADEPYQQVATLFAEPNSYGLGDGALERGIFQVSLRYPVSRVAEDGIGQVTARAEAIRAAFPKNLTVGGVVKVARRPEITRLGVDGDRDVTIIRVRFIER